MSTSRTELLRWQADLTWSLFTYHLDRLEPGDFLREPAAVCWTVHEDADGRWWPDWAESEPDPVPVPTIAWLTWHIGWWWTTAVADVRGTEPPGRTEIAWPGEGAAAVAWLRELREEWTAVLDGLDDAALDRPSAYPWDAEAGLTVGHTAAWVNAELMKNAAEIGQLRLRYAAER
ncbi:MULTISPECIES: DinB family protein [Streptomyces]|uniref:DinB family protein n=1 Tax=Streptomyces TaxID=1883 RepID=UPI00101E4C81|nr:MULTISPECIES: DinB family protein [Streptomyces]NVI31050.1 DinB family protein [Streptomyces sp. CAI-17]MDI3343508.1 DinB family protein [Streptomyces sp. AJ-1]RZD91211.1 damage-inducible protein DinB [Streptomyces albidoflavus]RZF00437.1 damage-inducible protein DinB [Streptomyces albidoflavus]RZF02236.1 damage-inducible protein DinB [Streptomyces albidoflavus]